MILDEFMKFIRSKPFVPFEVALTSGDHFAIQSPEVIATETLIVAVESNGDLVWFAPELVSAVRVRALGRRNGKRAS